MLETASIGGAADRLGVHRNTVAYRVTTTRGETLLVAAHGNSLRAIVKLLFGVSDDAIVGVEIPTGNPLVIELDLALKPTAARYLDPERATPIPAI